MKRPLLRLAPGLCLAALGALAQSPAPEVPVATIGKQAIPARELDSRTADALKKQHDTYEQALVELRTNNERQRDAIVSKELGQLIDDKVLALEAASRKTSADALLAATAPPPVTDKQVEDFYSANKERITQPLAAIAPQIKDYLGKQAQGDARRHYLDGLRVKYHAVATLEPLREKVATTGPSRGPADAPITIVEFSDFECPFCGRFEPVMRDVLKKYPKQVRVVYRNFPLTGLHPDAERAAEAAVCAQDQGKFWELHDSMFADQRALGAEALKGLAKHDGLDGAKFDECLDSGRAAEAVNADAAAAHDLGLMSTPSTFVNGRLVNGAVSFEQMSAIIDDELRRDGLTARR